MSCDLQASIPGEAEHEQTATDHDAKSEERDEYRRPVCLGPIGQSRFLRCQAHRADYAAEIRHADCEIVRLRLFVRPTDKHLGGGLLIMPTRLDRRELGRLFV